ncbi:MAG: phosphoribosylanthranilate isomerase [Dehalococcoidia bacterium]|tara:strand:- start:276 stop:1004 length:729 start_codon:yes stop_codon:yes gene_type:complete
MKIKICGIKDVATAEFCKELGVDFIGLVFTKSSRKVNVQTAKQIVNSLGEPLNHFNLDTIFPESSIKVTNKWFEQSHEILDSYIKVKKPLTVGIFAKESVGEINDIIEETGIDLVQLAGEYNIEDALAINRKTLYSLGINNLDAEYYKSKIRAGFALSLIFDSISSESLGGTGKSFNWNIIKDMSIQIPFILAGGLNIDNVELAMKSCDPWGLDVSTGVEKNGAKDFGLIREFVSKVRDFDD